MKPMAKTVRRGCIFAAVLVLLSAFLHRAAGADTNQPAFGGTSPADIATHIRKTFFEARGVYQSQKTNVEAAWHFSRACFDMADIAENDVDRAETAQAGIDAARDVISREPNNVAGHYYLAMNLGELARTKSLGALKLVSEMEHECLAAQRLDEHFDYGGPDRNLGLLYRDAPSIVSVGNRTKARQCLRHAVDLAPEYPENRLNLIESYLLWRDTPAARGDLKKLEDLLPEAHEKFTGADWAASWLDWDRRLASVRRKIQTNPKVVESPRGREN
jgi:tetratricopeptide (TPR) repeat protein